MKDFPIGYQSTPCFRNYQSLLIATNLPSLKLTSPLCYDVHSRLAGARIILNVFNHEFIKFITPHQSLPIGDSDDKDEHIPNISKVINSVLLINRSE